MQLYFYKNKDTIEETFLIDLVIQASWFYDLLYRHNVESDRWNKFKLTQEPHSNTYSVSLREAVHIWLTTANQTHPVEFRDSCHVAHCNKLCPEVINFELDNSHLWPDSIEIFVYAIVGIVTLLCFFLKGLLFLWHWQLLRKQWLFLEHSKDAGMENANFQVSVVQWYIKSVQTYIIISTTLCTKNQSQG